MNILESLYDMPVSSVGLSCVLFPSFLPEFLLKFILKYNNFCYNDRSRLGSIAFFIEIYSMSAFVIMKSSLAKRVHHSVHSK